MSNVKNAKYHSAVAAIFYEEIERSRLFTRAGARSNFPATADFAHELAINLAERLQQFFDHAKVTNINIGRRTVRPKTVAPSPRQLRGF